MIKTFKLLGIDHRISDEHIIMFTVENALINLKAFMVGDLKLTQKLSIYVPVNNTYLLGDHPLDAQTEYIENFSLIAKGEVNYCNVRYFNNGIQNINEQKCMYVSHFKETVVDQVSYEKCTLLYMEVPPHDISKAKFVDFELSVENEHFRLSLHKSQKLNDQMRISMNLLKTYKQILFERNMGFFDLPLWESSDEISLVYLGQEHQLESYFGKLLRQYRTYPEDVYAKICNLEGIDPVPYLNKSKTMKHLTPKVVTLDHHKVNKFMQNQLNSYFISDKIDGETSLCIIASGLLYMTTTREAVIYHVDTDIMCVFDAEYVQNENTLYPFDCRFMDDSLLDKPFHERLEKLEKIYNLVPTNEDVSIKIIKKRWHKIESNELDEIIDFTEQKVSYPVDGFVFVFADDIKREVGKHTYYENIIWKWKKPHEITVDFLIKRCPIEWVSLNPYYKDPEKPYIYLLCCGYQKNAYSMQCLVNVPRGMFNHTTNYIPALFTPSDNPYQHIYRSTDPDLHDKIGEFGWNGTSWVLFRFREDKYEWFKRGLYFGNDHQVAELNWLMINYPLHLKSIKYVQNDISGVRPLIVEIYNSVFEHISSNSYVIDIGASFPEVYRNTNYVLAVHGNTLQNNRFILDRNNPSLLRNLRNHHTFHKIKMYSIMYNELSYAELEKRNMFPFINNAQTFILMLNLNPTSALEIYKKMYELVKHHTKSLQRKCRILAVVSDNQIQNVLQVLEKKCVLDTEICIQKIKFSIVTQINNCSLIGLKFKV
jgi:hypothetical protein